MTPPRLCSPALVFGSAPVCALVCALACAEPRPPESPLKSTQDVVPADLEELRQAFEDVAADAAANDFSGIALLAVGDEVVCLTPFGPADRETERAVEPTTAFPIGSITKQVTAGAALRLRDEGSVEFDVGVGTYVPELEADKAAITIHQLLTHTSGLPEFFASDDELLTQADFLERVNAATLTPADEFHYSNVGLSLVAVVIERTTAMSYEDAVRALLLEPAGITQLGSHGVSWDDLAIGYDGEQRWGTILDLGALDDGHGYNLRGNGGLLATATAMHAWTRMLVAGDVLNPASIQDMFTRHVQTDHGEVPVFSGYGWKLLDWPSGPMSAVATHTGSNGIFYAYTLYYIEEDVHLYVAVSTGEQEGVFTVRAYRTLVNNWLTTRSAGSP